MSLLEGVESFHTGSRIGGVFRTSLDGTVSLVSLSLNLTPSLLRCYMYWWWCFFRGVLRLEDEGALPRLRELLGGPLPLLLPQGQCSLPML